MTTVTCETKQWGNSLGVIIPKKAVRQLHLKPHEQIVIEIKEQKTNVLAELFGSGKFSKPTGQLIKEVRKELESRY